jgi:Tol biopolymer transport system component
VPLITEGQNGRPTWSGSGQMIFFNRTEGQNTGLYAFMMATRETVQLTTQAANEYGPDWTPR